MWEKDSLGTRLSFEDKAVEFEFKPVSKVKLPHRAVG